MDDLCSKFEGSCIAAGDGWQGARGTGAETRNCFKVSVFMERNDPEPWQSRKDETHREDKEREEGVQSWAPAWMYLRQSGSCAMVLCVSGFPAARLEQDPSGPAQPEAAHAHYFALAPMSDFALDPAPPHSRVLVSPAKPGEPAPTKNAISLRYQPMTMADPTSPAPTHRKKPLDPPMASSRHKSSPVRNFRPKTSPVPRHMFEAVPNSWASASRLSDLRPNPPAPQPPCKAPRPSPTPPPTQSARPNTVRLRSKSADRVATKTSVSGPRSPKRGALVQPTPKRLSLGMVMDTAKLVSASSTSSDLGSSVSVPLSKPILPLTATNTVPIRSLPASPNGPPCIARLPISGSHYKRDLSPSPVSPIHRPTSPASPPVLGPKPLPVPPLPSLQPPVPPSPRRPMLHLNPTVPLSPFTPSAPSIPPSWSPKSPFQSSIASPSTATTTTGTASSCISPSDCSTKYDESSHVKRDRSNESPASTWSSGYFTSPLSQQNDRQRASDKPEPTIHPPFLSSSPRVPPSLSTQEEVEEEEEEEEREDILDNLDAYDWTLEQEEEFYDDQLFRIPISPTALPGSGSDADSPLEVFVDNMYCGEPERSPSPITYARPAGSDFSDEELSGNGGGEKRKKHRRRAHHAKEEGASRTSHSRVPGDAVGATAGRARSPSNGNRRHSRRSDPSSPISYHSDDSSLYITGNRPLPSRRRRREQLRSYRYSFRPPVSPTAKAAATAASLNTLAGFSGKAVRRVGGAGGGGKGLDKGLEGQRSPSPIEYARRRSLDGLYDFDSEGEMDDGDGEVVFVQPPPAQQQQQRRDSEGGGDAGLVAGWWESSAIDFLLADGRRRFGGAGVKRRTVQPRSFMHAYSKPPDVTAFSEERERVLEKEKERGRKKERTPVVPMPLVNYSNNSQHNQNTNNSNTLGNGNNKERSKEKDGGKEKQPRTRKGSRGFLDELAAVAIRKTNNNNHNVTPPRRTSGGSPPPLPQPASLPSLPPLPFHSRERDRDEKEKEKKRKWVWELSKSDGSSKDKLFGGGGGGNGSTSTLAASSGENVLVLDIGSVNNGGGNSNKWGGGGGSSEGYEGWNAEWPGDDDLVGGNRKGKKQRHSLNGLEFV